VTSTDVEALIREIPDFPIPGIRFRDITPLLKDAGGFKATIDLFVARYRAAI
jgi:adenine phosphoribosyltransferase